MRQPLVYLLSCGDELLFGHTVDTNSAWLADHATRLGWRVIGHRTVGDVTPDIVQAILEAAEKTDVILFSGGLGPTEDDRTRQALAAAMDVELEEKPELVEAIRARFKAFGREMRPVNRVQAQIPQGALAIPNNNGTAPGIHARIGRAEIFVMPGVPKEMRQMFKEYVQPVMEKTPTNGCEVLRRLHLLGLGESDIGDALKEFMREKNNPEVGTAVADAIVTVRMYGRGKDRSEAEKIIYETETVIRHRLGEHIFAADQETIADTVVKLLREKQAGLAVAESCTGGLLANMIVEVPGASEVFYEAIVAYANVSKTRHLGVADKLIEQHGAVSKEVAIAMAEGAANNLLNYTDRPVYSLATTGIAGPGGGTAEKPVGTVWIACSLPGEGKTRKTLAFRQRILSDRQGIRLRAANYALDFLRRSLLNIPYPWDVEA